LGIGAAKSSNPAWSPDGSIIAFTIGCSAPYCASAEEADSTQIALFNLKTRATTKLSSGHSPAWSPDVTRLVFAGNSDLPGLQIINIDGSGLTRITTDAHDTAPSWR
jgi:Tol biopolymer transport system component